jgi:hypothetical protein
MAQIAIALNDQRSKRVNSWFRQRQKTTGFAILASQRDLSLRYIESPRPSLKVTVPMDFQLLLV